MNKMINFGVDLGTTNSLIAKFNHGIVEVFKNPNGFKETLPSVVAFRNDRIMVGDQAKTFAEKDAQSVGSRFKRKMGTTEKIKIKSLNTSKTPVELSSFVLKELKSFVHTGEIPESVVITIPASFDTVQSNATKEAGYLAGFKQVVLLQEPIAASLAFANKDKNTELNNTQWIVYDFGGGTFDVALVKILDGELTVIDHEGDNFLGGGDFDSMIVEKIVIPELNKKGSFTDLEAQMKSGSGKYNRLWPILLHKAEEAKIELTTKQSAEIDLGLVRDLEDENGNTIDSIITITRSDFESAIKEKVDSTAEMIRKILTRNSLQPSDLQFILMVGGSTYVPYLRKRIHELLEIPVNTSIDPTNAIVVGAAYFAANRAIDFQDKNNKYPKVASQFRIRASYSRSSQEKEEVFTAKVEGTVDGLYYRITNQDGSYDSGLKKLSSRIVEDLPLQEGAYNLFAFRVYDAQNNVIPNEFESIQIAQGKYSVAGQMLPEDICLVKDDVSIHDTVLDRLFGKNSLLPAKSKKTVEVGKTIPKGSDIQLRIIVVEGSSDNHSSTNKPIGHLVINGTQISKDLIKGTDIDLTFEMSESRDLTVSAFLNGTGQEFSQVFDPKPRAVPIETLSEEIQLLESKIDSEIDEAESLENYDVVESLNKLKQPIEELIGEASLLSIDDVTDDRFKLEDKKRLLAQQIFLLTAGKKIEKAKADFFEAKREAMDIVSKHGNDIEKHQLNEILAKEHLINNSTNLAKIQSAANDLENIKWRISGRIPEFLQMVFSYLCDKRASMNDEIQAKNLIENGKRHITADAWDLLREVNSRLVDLLPRSEKKHVPGGGLTGIQ
jgi:molecular chaperone DnaK